MTFCKGGQSEKGGRGLWVFTLKRTKINYSILTERCYHANRPKKRDTEENEKRRAIYKIHKMPKSEMVNK